MLSSSSSSAVRVEKATSELLIGTDWTINIDICDYINSDHWQAKDVVKAVKKRLQNKNPKVQFLALTLLETMIKNCGDYVHFQVVERGILQEMIKIVKKKNDIEVRDKTLALLDSWQEAFGGPGAKYPHYYWAYVELKRSGVQFPPRSTDSALIFTPPITHTRPITGHPQAGYGMPSSSSSNLDEAMASEMSNLSISDLDGIQSVMELLSEMLKAVNPNDRQAVKDDVITDLVSQCQANQKKLMNWLNSTGDEELLGQGLVLNDNLQNVLAKHDALASGSPLPPEPLEPPLPRPSTPVASAPAVTNRFEEDEEEDDDDFTRLAHRNTKPNPGSTQSTYSESGDATTASSSTEASSSMASNELALPEPPAPVKTVSKEQEMIDLLSITLSSNPTPPQTPPVTPPPPIQNGNGYPYNPQPYTSNQGYNPYNSYVAPWAQARPQPPVPQVSSSYPPPPWEVSSSSNSNPFPLTAYPFQASYYNSSAASVPAARVPTQTSWSMQQYNSSGSRVNSAAATAGGIQVNAGPRQPAPAASAKPYVLSSRLFEDLIDLRNPDGSLKTSNAAPRFSDATSQGTIGGRR